MLYSQYQSVIGGAHLAVIGNLIDVSLRDLRANDLRYITKLSATLLGLRRKKDARCCYVLAKHEYSDRSVQHRLNHLPMVIFHGVPHVEPVEPCGSRIHS